MSDPELEIRAFDIEFREDSEEGTFEGIAVPWGQTVNIGGKFRERFERGSIDPSESISLYRDHKSLIGHVVKAEDREEGLWVRAKVALSDLGKDTLALLRSGALSKLSVGFVPVEHRTDGDVTVRSRVSLREVSVVERPAYSLASVLAVREEESATPTLNAPKEAPVTDVTPSDLTEVRESVEDLERRMSAFTHNRTDEPAVDNRSAAAVLKAVVKGDESTVARFSELLSAARSDVEERAYTGGTTAAAPVKDGWVGDLTRIFDNSSGVLSSIFETGTLPAEGNNIEFAQLKSNTMQVTQQVNEGDDLAYGAVTLETKTAPVKTYGGYTQLSRQAIDRSTLPVLNRSLEALAQAAGKRAKIELRTAFNALVAERSAIASNGGVVVLGSTLAAATYQNFVNALVDAAGKFDDNALNIDRLVLSPSVFKKLAGLTGTDGRPMLSFDGSGANTVGSLNVTALSGSFVGVPFVVDSGATGDTAALVNSRAIRVYQSGLVSLQDENIINLSKDFSVYRYAAIAAEIPAGVVPIKLAAS
jgi:HK97 family phage prohead protease/HK97 family phage major capsid protein